MITFKKFIFRCLVVFIWIQILIAGKLFFNNEMVIFLSLLCILHLISLSEKLFRKEHEKKIQLTEEEIFIQAQPQVKENVKGETLRGVNLFSLNRINERLGTRNKHSKDIIRIAGVKKHPKDDFHIIASGDSGTGKTVFIKSILKQLNKKDDVTVIVFDVERDFTNFYNQKRGDIILNPCKENEMCFWDLKKEYNSKTELKTLIESIIPNTNKGHKDDYFIKSARTLLQDLMQYTDWETPRDLFNWLYKPTKELYKFFKEKGAVSSALMNPGAEQQASGIKSTLMNYIQSFEVLPFKKDDRAEWNARDWIKNNNGWLFFQSNESGRKSSLELTSIWLDCLIRNILDLDKDKINKEIWIIADEVASLGQLSSLESAMTRTRKRKTHMLIGYQNISQLKDIYGHHATTTITSQPRIKLFLRSSDFETASYCANIIGQRERLIDRKTTSVTYTGIISSTSGKSEHKEQRIEHLILPSQIQHLETLYGFVVVHGAGIAKVNLKPLIKN